MLHHRPIPAKPGLRGWIADPALPEGLEEDTPVALLRREGDGFVVATDDGTQWVLPAKALDCGREFLLDNRWLPESHPEAIAALAAEVARLRFTQVNALNPGAVNVEINAFETILERNGMAV